MHPPEASDPSQIPDAATSTEALGTIDGDGRAVSAFEDQRAVDGFPLLFFTPLKRRTLSPRNETKKSGKPPYMNDLSMVVFSGE